MIPKELVRHELIGLSIKILDAANQRLVGLQGKVIDETKNMIIIKSNEYQKKIIKGQVKMEIKIGNEKVMIDGKYLVGKPHERIRK